MTESRWKNTEWATRYFDIRLAVLAMQAGETREEAWRRHVSQRP